MKNMRFISIDILNERKLIKFSMVLLIILRIICNYQISYFFDLEGIYLYTFIKFLTMLFLIIAELLCI